MIMYKAEFFSSQIRKIKVSRDTKNFVVLLNSDGSDGCRIAKDSLYDCVRATFNDAKNVLVSKRLKSIKNAKILLNHCEEKLNKAKSLTEGDVKND